MTTRKRAVPERLAPAPPQRAYLRLDYGAVIALLSSATWLCASALPFNDAWVFSVIAVFERMIPSKCEFAPSVASPATCQKMFFAWAPPLNTTFLAAAMERSPLVWKIQTSLAPPAMVTSVGMVTVLVHL